MMRFRFFKCNHIFISYHVVLHGTEFTQFADQMAQRKSAILETTQK